jgi:nucleotide-binding universal stress UspA family protein
MNKILVPTDFSFAARNAAIYAVNLAKDIGATVVLLHIYPVPVPMMDIPIIAITPDELQLESERLLKIELDFIEQQTSVIVQIAAKMGLTVDEILEEEKSAFMLVMGMKVATKVSEHLIGSITTTVLRKVKTPLLVIPENSSYKKPEKIVFACDYNSKTHVDTVESLKKFSKIFDAKIYIVNIMQDKSIKIDKSLQTKLDSELSELSHIYYFSEKEDLVEGIIEFVNLHKADMIAIIPHQYNLIEHLFHKSISKKIAFHTHVPLITLPDNHITKSGYLL